MGYRLSFRRFDFPHEHTAAFGRFRDHHTEINKLYWSFIPASKAAYKATSGYTKDNQTVSALGSHGQDTRRYPPTLGEWQNSFKEFTNWTRLNAIMAASSYFEIFFRTVINLALLSKPGVLLGDSEIIDGVKLLKQDNSTLLNAINSKIDSCIKGEWSYRSSSFSSLFGSSFEKIFENISDLEKIRKIRNSVGHSFGRDLNFFSYIYDDNMAMHRVGEERMKKYLKLLLDLANSIDAFLLKNYIGSFEAIFFFHKNISQLYIPERKNKAKKMKEEFHYRSTVPMLSTQYCFGLVEYYYSIINARAVSHLSTSIRSQ